MSNERKINFFPRMGYKTYDVGSVGTVKYSRAKNSKGWIAQAGFKVHGALDYEEYLGKTTFYHKFGPFKTRQKAGEFLYDLFKASSKKKEHLARTAEERMGAPELTISIFKQMPTGLEVYPSGKYGARIHGDVLRYRGEGYSLLEALENLVDTLKAGASLGMQDAFHKHVKKLVEKND